LHSAQSGVSFNSTEEQSSSRRERQEPSENRKRNSQERRERDSNGTGSGTRKGTAEGPPDENRETRFGREPATELGRASETRPARESERKPVRVSKARLTQHSGNWVAAHGTRSSYDECDDGVRETVSSARTSRITLEWRVVVIWVPNRIFEKSESKGRDLEREIAPSLLRNQSRCSSLLGPRLIISSLATILRTSLDDGVRMCPKEHISLNQEVPRRRGKP
jgi:hypothetical protein